jgi:hypothetical protein
VSLDWTIAKFVLPRLRRFREVANGYPEDAGSMAGWLAKIDDMIYAIEIYANGHWDAPPILIGIASSVVRKRLESTLTTFGGEK